MTARSWTAFVRYSHHSTDGCDVQGSCHRGPNQIHILRRRLDLLQDLRHYNAMTDATPYVVMDARQYATMAAMWPRFREKRREWQNHNAANNAAATFKRHVKWAGIEPRGSLSLHVLRKCCITNWANSISKPEVVRKLTQHAYIKTTMQYYCRVTEQQRRKAAEAIDRLLETGSASNGTYED